jgi:hypothetical protein
MRAGRCWYPPRAHKHVACHAEKPLALMPKGRTHCTLRSGKTEDLGPDSAPIICMRYRCAAADAAAGADLRRRPPLAHGNSEVMFLEAFYFPKAEKTNFPFFLLGPLALLWPLAAATTPLALFVRLQQQI